VRRSEPGPYDLRGHRESDPATDGYTLDRLAADALAVADAAGVGEVILVGFSMTRQVRPVLDGASFVDRLASITAPSLVIGASGDPMFPPDMLRTVVVPPLAGARLELIDSPQASRTAGSRRRTPRTPSRP
jgi:pimeloyl-ACP methyl ester carboxylesterase